MIFILVLPPTECFRPWTIYF